ncbi:MAG: hypothetical protein JWP89_1495 [Schlesneria sp.]|nr:hypothetical protein [Schlesneria sp.]
MDNGYVWTWPVYLVYLQHDGQVEVPIVPEGEGGQCLNGLAVFTEELLAERFRAKWKATAVIVPVLRIELLDTIKRLLPFIEATHVVIDPDDHVSCPWIPFAEI